jgi:anti-sigma B factor antagonist
MDKPISTSRLTDGILGITLRHEIDFTNAPAVSDAIRAAMSDDRPSTVRVDMTDVTFLDSSGIGVLVVAYKEATAAGAEYEVVGPNPAVFEQLRLTGLVDLFGIEPPHISVP